MDKGKKDNKLNSPLEEVFRLNPTQKKALKKLGLQTIEDLLFHFPTRYGNVSQVKNIKSLVHGEEAVVFGKIHNLKTSKGFKTKIPMASGTVKDDTGSIKVVWFNQPYIAKMIGEGSLVRIEGKISQKRRTDAERTRNERRSGELYFSNPKTEKVEKLPTGVGDSLFGEESEMHHLYPVYPESRGITSNWFFHAIQKVFKNGVLDEINDPIPQEILDKYKLPSLKTALIWIHAPMKEDHSISARKRFAFQEIFFIQIEKQKERKNYEKLPSFKIEKSPKDVQGFIDKFPFKPTKAQSKAIGDILSDFKKDRAMSRLLEGDVGSGKTAVAAASVYATVTTRPNNQDFGNLQVAYMAPTEILAEQHFQSFIKYFENLNISIALITGSGCKKFPSKVNPKQATNISRAQLLKWVANGEIPILIGTHALIQKKVEFENLAYVIIDEQHRFGTAQRQKLRKKKDEMLPHLLSMTATPIPRTLALTIFGDLDLTLLDEMPHGRKPIITEIVLPDKRDETYKDIKKELEAGRQMYVICPRINEPDPTKALALNVKSVKEEAKRLKRDIFQNYEIGILHSKMKPSEKDGVMADFKEGVIDILVATSVVEVGVNVPNATVIIIEGAERFGLSQLHQLRGRVIRSDHQAYCYVFSDTKTQKTLERLKALKTAKNGFELAEFDLAQRGAGDLYGRKQWGVSDLAMEAMKNIKMVEASRNEAQIIIEEDPELKSLPEIKEIISKKQAGIHFE